MKIFKNEKIMKPLLIILTMSALALNCVNIQANNTNTNNINAESISPKDEVSVVYSSHVQDFGWEQEFSKENGQESGSTGKNKKNEAIKIKLKNAPNNMKSRSSRRGLARVERRWRNCGNNRTKQKNASNKNPINKYTKLFCRI